MKSRRFRQVTLMLVLILAGTALLFAGGEREPEPEPAPDVHAAPDIDQAEQEGRAVFYANITAVEPIMENFFEEYGVEADYTRISTAVYLPTVMTEFRAGALPSDVFQAPMPVMEILKDEGVLGEYVSPMADLYPDWAADPDGVIQQFGIEYVALIYNTDLVSPDEVPTSYRDLTDPRWNDEIVMADPSTHATTITWLVGVKEHVFDDDEDAWREWLHGVAANRPMFVRSFGPTPGPIETGEKQIAISMPKYIVTRAPAPLGWADVGVTGEPLMGTPRGIAVRRNAERPNAARLFIDYWLSEASARVLTEQVGEYVLHEGIYPPIDGIEAIEVLPLRTLANWEIDHWAAEFEDIFYD